MYQSPSQKIKIFGNFGTCSDSEVRGSIRSGRLSNMSRCSDSVSGRSVAAPTPAPQSMSASMTWMQKNGTKSSCSVTGSRKEIPASDVTTASHKIPRRLRFQAECSMAPTLAPHFWVLFERPMIGHLETPDGFKTKPEHPTFIERRVLRVL